MVAGVVAVVVIVIAALLVAVVVVVAVAGLVVAVAVLSLIHISGAATSGWHEAATRVVHPVSSAGEPRGVP